MKKKKFSLSDLMRSKIPWAVIAEMLILLVGSCTGRQAAVALAASTAVPPRRWMPRSTS